MDPRILHDPAFHELLKSLEVAAKRLRDTVIALRAFYLDHNKAGHEETQAERWKGALLSSDASAAHEKLEDAAAGLLRYGYELAPHDDSEDHRKQIEHLKEKQYQRILTQRSESTSVEHPRGFEERVHVEEGHPLTLVIRPEYWHYTERAKQTLERKQPAINPDTDPGATSLGNEDVAPGLS